VCTKVALNYHHRRATASPQCLLLCGHDFQSIGRTVAYGGENAEDR
jgi:hypothetical protein